jgi:hypothetical protein
MTTSVRLTTPVTSAAARKQATAPPRVRRPRGGGEDLEEVARAAAALAGGRPAGGPLGLHAAPAAPAPRGPVAIDGVADRLLVGRTREGLPEVRIELAAGGWRGTEVRLVAGKHGLEATLVVASEAARRVVESQLADLARALESRGVRVARCEVAARGEPRREQPR